MIISTRTRRWCTPCCVLGGTVLVASIECQAFTTTTKTTTLSWSSTRRRQARYATIVPSTKGRQVWLNWSDKRNSDKDWEAGDVYEDLKRLEQAIAFSNAEQDLQHQERLETLSYCAQQRRPIILVDIIKYVVRPLTFSISLAVLLKPRSIPLLVRRGVEAVSVVHFWLCVVIAPMLLYSVKRWTALKSTDYQLPEELKGLDPDYFDFLTTTDWEDPRTSCRDYVLCLLEQWVSCVLGTALAGLFFYFFSNMRHSWWPLLQFATRMAALASLHQYPKLWFQLIRTEQPRPIQWSVWAMQSLVALQFTPWMVGIDLARFAASTSLRWKTLGFGYGAGFGLVCLFLASARFVTPERVDRLRTFQFRPPFKAMFKAAAIAWILGRRRYITDSLYKTMTTLGALSVEEFLVFFPWKKLLTGIGLGVAAVGPLCHVLAFKKLFRMAYTHGLSLGTDVNQFKQALSKIENIKNNNTATNDDNYERQQSRLQWRYRLTWREPQRILVTLESWHRGFWYWVFFAGSVRDKLWKEFHAKRQNETRARGLTVLQRVAKYLERNPDAPMPDRTKWKENAMNQIAREHQKDYDSKSFDDPLGIAVHQSLGIGLGFKFDHMKELKDSELPTTRRLQARAAKSAVKRAQEIYDAEDAREELDKIADPIDRDRKGAGLRQHVDPEIKELAQRLSDLIPTDMDLGFDTGIEQFNSWERVSANEYVIRSPTIKSLFKNLHVPSWDDEAKATESGDEFIEEWLKRYADSTTTNTNSTDNEKNDEDDNIRTVLV